MRSSELTVAACGLMFVLACSLTGHPDSQAPPPTRPSDQEEAGPLYPMRQGAKWGFMNREGKVVIEPKFDYAWDFQEDRALVLVDGDWGYIDRAGELVIPAIYEIAGDFSEGLAAVTGKEDFLRPRPMGEFRGPPRVGYIDKTGKGVIEPKYYGNAREATFRDGRALVRLEAVHVEGGTMGTGHRQGYIDRGGGFVVPAEYDYGDPFSEGLAKVWKDNKAMFIDTTGKVVTDVTHYTSTGSFSGGLASVAEKIEQDGKVVKKIGFIDRKGKLVISPTYDQADAFSEGLAAVALGWNHPTSVPKGQEYVPAKWGYIDTKGEVVIERRYWFANSFHGGLASVQEEEGGKWAFIDRHGKVVIPAKYDSTRSFHNGLASVTVGDRWEAYEGPGMAHGMRLVPGKMSYLDKTGKVVWEAKE